MDKYNPRLLEAAAQLRAELHQGGKAGAPVLLPMYQPFRVSDLSSADLPPLQWAVVGLLPAGLTIFAAPPKTGKSLACLALAAAVAADPTQTGTFPEFWGFSVIPGDVLYVDLEDSKRRLLDRFEKMRLGRPRRLEAVIKTPGLDDGLLLYLKEWIESKEAPRLIIIDTLARVKGKTGARENSYDADTRMLAPLQELAIEKGVAILVVTHLKKAGGGAAPDDPFERIMGSNGQFGVADSAWLISGKRNAEEMTFSATGRDIDALELKITLDRASLRWKLLGTSEALEEQRIRSEYNANPIVVTLRQLTTYQPWKGTAQQLLDQIAVIAHAYPVETPRALASQLRQLRPMLLDNDGIVCGLPEYGNSRGRLYTFIRKGTTFTESE